MTSTRRAIAVVVCAVMLASCAKNGLGSKKPICVRRPPAAVSTVEQVDNIDWVHLLLSDEDKHYDCTAQPLRFAPLSAECGTARKAAPPRYLTLDRDEIVARNGDGGFGVVWIPLQARRSGDRGGPVALVHTAKRLSVIALGMLELPTQGLSLKMQTFAGTEMLVAEGQRCDKATKACDRVLRLMRLDRDKLVPVEFYDHKNNCLGRTSIDLLRTVDTKRRNGQIRRFTLNATYQLVPEGIELHEQMVVTDRRDGTDPNQARPFRTSDSKRLLTIDGSNLRSNKESLWTRMLAIHGDVRKGGSSDN